MTHINSLTQNKTRIAIFAGGFILAFAFLVYMFIKPTASNSFINGEELDGLNKNNYVFVEVAKIAQGLGHKVTENNGVVTITKKDGTVVVIKANGYTAKIGNQYFPYVTTNKGGLSVPVAVTPILQNGKVFVPMDFITSKYGLNFTATKDGSKYYFGTKPVVSTPPVQTPTPTPTPTPPSSGTGGSTGTKYPDGWVAPVLNHTWSPDAVVNDLALQQQLGFNAGMGYDISQQPDVIRVRNQDKTSGQEVWIWLKGWNIDLKEYPEAYRIKVIAKEVFKLYFGSDYMRVYNYFEINDIPDTFTANGRTVKSEFDKTGALIMKVGVKK